MEIQRLSYAAILCVYLFQGQTSLIFSDVATQTQKAFLWLPLVLLILLCLLDVHFKSGFPEADQKNAPRSTWSF